MEVGGGGEEMDSWGMGRLWVTTSESTAYRRLDLLLIRVTSPSEIDEMDSASFASIPSSRILLFPNPTGSDSSDGTAADLVACLGRLAPFFFPASFGILYCLNTYCGLDL